MASSLVIRQLEPPRRVITLSDDCAPLVGFEESTEQRGEVAYFKGSNVGRARLDGSQEGEVEFNFVFRDRNMQASRNFLVTSSSEAVTTADAGCELLREMVRDSVIVSVEFEGLESVGYLKMATKGHRRLGERDFSLTYQPIRPDRYEAQKKVPLAADSRDMLSDARNNWLGFLGQARVPLATAKEKLDFIRRAANGIGSAISEASSFLGDVRGASLDALSLSSGIVGPLRNISLESDRLMQSFKEPPASFAGSDDAEDIINAMGQQASAEKTTRDLRHSSTAERRKLELSEREDLIGIHTAVKDEDLRLVCFNAYGTSNVWVQVASFNGLRGSRLTGGQRVLLPRIDSREGV